MDHTAPLAQARAARLTRLIVALAALAVIALALARLGAAERGVVVERAVWGDTPVAIWRPAAGPVGPAVVVAHGFAGSQPLMRGFAATLARNGYVAVSFDFLGHGRHPVAMNGDVTAVDGATAGILGQLGAVAARARSLGDGRLALLGHSMAGDVIARQALADPTVAATVGVSILSPVVGSEGPRNLLLVTGAWEAGLTDWALETLRAVHGAGAGEGGSYGDMADGTARRVVFAPAVEHIGVLYSDTALREAATWLNAVFDRQGDVVVASRGPWVALLLAGIVALGWPLAALLPRRGGVGEGAGLGGWRFALAATAPAVLTPLALSLTEFRFLPMVVGDYLAVHFALSGLLTAAAMALLGAARPPRGALAAAAPGALAVAVFALGALGWALHAHVSNFAPIAARAGVLAALLAGMAPYFLADEWLTRGARAPRGAYPLTKLAFLGSLAAATALDLERLFFLIILAPALGLFFIVFGLFSRWAHGATGRPWVGAAANAIVFAWAVGVTFPLVE